MVALTMVLATALADEPTGRAFLRTLETREVTSVHPELVMVPGARKRSPVIVQYSDWRCPHCLVALPRTLEIARRTGAELRLRLFPLDGACNPALESGDGERCLLARASVCAIREGRLDAFLESAVPMLHGLSEVWLRDPTVGPCTEHPEVALVVEEHARAGVRDGIPGTPTFFVRVDRKRWVEVFGPDAVDRLLTR